MLLEGLSEGLPGCGGGLGEGGVGRRGEESVKGERGRGWEAEGVYHFRY